jgi:hypothetical protein
MWETLCVLCDLCGKNRNVRELVPGAGLEPARELPHMALNHARLPVPPSRQGKKNAGFTRVSMERFVQCGQPYKAAQTAAQAVFREYLLESGTD